MTDDDRISRRAALTGIAASGALLGSSVAGVAGVGATGGKTKDHEKGTKDAKRHGEAKHTKGHGKDAKEKKAKDEEEEKDRPTREDRKRAREIAQQVAFNFECYDPYNEAARFYLHHGEDTDVTFGVRIRETGAEGAVTVENSLATAETFWVAAPDGEATVDLYYNGVHIATAASDPNVVCDG